MMEISLIAVAMLLGAVLAVVGRAFVGVQRENDRSKAGAEKNRVEFLADVEQNSEPQHVDLHRYQQDQWISSEVFSPWRDIVQGAIEELRRDGTTDIVIAIHLEEERQKTPTTPPADSPRRKFGRSEIRVIITRQ